MTRRIVVREPDGKWIVRPAESERVSSIHTRLSDARARAKEILKNAGGGEWLVQDPAGHTIESGKV